MRFYDFLIGAGFPRSYVGKFLLVNFIGIHVPVIGLAFYAVFFGPYPVAETWPFLAVTVAATGLGTAAALSANYALLAPVRAVSSAMRQYLHDKTVAALPVNDRDEAGQLMGDVMEGITRLDHAIDAAQAAREETEAHHRASFTTLSEMGHELRTPLNHIIGFSEVMQNSALPPLGNSGSDEYAAIIGQSGAEMLRVVESILELSEIESERVDYEVEAVDLAAMGRNVFGLAHHQASQRGVKLVYRAEMDIGSIAGDTRALKQILQQSVLIALESTPDHGELEISLTTPGSEACFEVRDCGHAFANDDIPDALRHCFEGDSDVHAGLQDIASVSRTGLSLVVIHALVERHGGTLELSNNKSGVGKSIRVRLPITAMADAADDERGLGSGQVAQTG